MPRPPRGVALSMVGLLVVWGHACGSPSAPPEPTPSNEDPVEDHEGPTLETEAITEPQPVDESVIFEAFASDPSGIYAVYLHYKPQNTIWQMLRMEALSEEGYYGAELTPEMLYGAGSLSYYLEAADGTDYHNVSYSPSTGAEAPYSFNIVGGE